RLHRMARPRRRDARRVRRRRHRDVPRRAGAHERRHARRQGVPRGGQGDPRTLTRYTEVMGRASIVIAFLAACWSQAVAPPATPTAPAEPPPAVQPPLAVKPAPHTLAHTMWRITTSDSEHHDFYFMDDGQLHYNSQSGFWKDGFWTQHGDEI